MTNTKGKHGYFSKEARAERKARRKSRGVIRQYAESIAWAAVIALAIRFFLLEPFQIPTGSMIPSLEIHDRLFVAKCSYGVQIPFMDTYLVRWSTPARGDVVVFPFPVENSEDYGKDFIKRVIGLPGDEIQLRNNHLVINGEEQSAVLEAAPVDCKVRVGTLEKTCQCIRQQESFGNGEFITRHIRADQPDLYCRELGMPDWALGRPYRVPEGTIFVMGDNRDNSHDSRGWGTVPIDTIKGKALFIWYADDLSRIFSSVP